MKKIDFSPPEIKPEDIRAVTKVLKSGWITTGPIVKEFEKALKDYTGAWDVICTNSATAALETILRSLSIGPGDEVITSVFTYSASASVIQHVGAQIVLADTIRDGFHLDPDEIRKKITERTKAVIAVDYAGIPAPYSKIREVINEKAPLYHPRKNSLQKKFSRVILIADAAHSLGASYKGVPCGNIADFSSFSFHAVKNLTTAEGGAIIFRPVQGMDPDQLKNWFYLNAFQGQNKDALTKLKGSWKYDIVVLGYKYNMTDIQAALGLSQLKRYAKILDRRKVLHERYVKRLSLDQRIILPEFDSSKIRSSYHLFPVRIKNFSEGQRDRLIRYLADQGISANVHFIPLPMHTAYKNLGFDIRDFPRSFSVYQNLVSLPLHLKLSLKDVDRVSEAVKKGIKTLS
ncbi:MAG: DegT/DnrJ/EryC1/StrS family aminotransferase [Candidatus Aureabacteria bacterium]|nr:DegT/DnrJ/EryC1/StrS family aminotransferase [Candidatus Auribacterota bacterium]